MNSRNIKLTIKPGILTWIALFSAVFFIIMGSRSVFAEEVPEAAAPGETRHPVSVTSGPDNDELFAGYVDSLMYPGKASAGSKIRKKAPRKNNLNDAEKAVYSGVYEAAAAIAGGGRDSAVIEIPFERIVGEDQLYYTKEELGVSWLYNKEEGYNPEVYDSINTIIDGTYLAYDEGTGSYDYSLFSEDSLLNPIKIVDSLLTDIPYELYWFDKTRGYCWYPRYKYDTKTDSILLTKFVYEFWVEETYWPENYTGLPEGEVIATPVDREKCGSASAAVAYAGEIAASASAYSDYGKLRYFRETIRNLVTYNNAAASSNGYGDPWQIIYVFDQDPETNVVCEGYSKAFKYLCDLSEFSDDNIECFIVSGSISAGAHMWNLMHMDDGENYLVDITNSRSEQSHFLSGGNMFGTYGTLGYGANDGSKYYYDTDAMSLFSEQELRIAPVSYTAMIHVENLACEESAVLYTDESAVLTAVITPSDASDKTVSWTSSDPSVLTVKAGSNGKCTLIPVKAGEATVTVETTDSKHRASCKVTVLQHVTGISVEETKELWTGDEPYTLEAEILPADASDRSVTWSSEDETIAAVDADGKVTPVSVGTTIIKAITSDGGYAASCEVTVKQHVEGISLDKQEISLERNSEDVTDTLTATVRPADANDKSVVWTSSDPDTVSVEADEAGSGCILTAKKAGTVEISAVTSDGGYAASCKVTVLQHVTGISLESEKDLWIGDEPTALLAEVLPVDAADQAVTWSSEDESIAAVDADGKVTPVSVGTTIIKAVTADGEFEAACTVTVAKKPAPTPDPKDSEGTDETGKAPDTSSGSDADTGRAGEKADVKGSDGTALGEGASAALAEKTLLASSSDKEPAGSVFRKLRARKKTVKKNSIKITWNRVSGAKSYIVYGGKCGKKMKKLATVRGTSYTQKKLKKGTYYKYSVVAISGSGSSARVVSTSKLVHITTLGGKRNNFKAIRLSKTSLKVKKGKTVRITAKAVKIGKKAAVHRKVAYESSNSKVASVSSRGVIRGLSKGTCKIYVYAQDGTFKTVRIKVV